MAKKNFLGSPKKKNFGYFIMLPETIMHEKKELTSFNKKQPIKIIDKKTGLQVYGMTAQQPPTNNRHNRTGITGI